MFSCQGNTATLDEYDEDDCREIFGYDEEDEE